jgi:hypothetical protein
MITRAYQNAKGERQEVAMTAAEWEALTDEQLQDMLGFKAPAAPIPVPAPAAAPAAAPFAKSKAKGK